MLSRRHLRIKAMNALYALEQDAFKDEVAAEKYLFDDHSLNLLKNQICFRLKKYNTRLHDYIYNAINFYEKKYS